jgi:hypothetical protein
MRVPVRPVLTLVFSLSLVQVASDVWPQGTAPRLSGLGYLDYRNKPRFKVGDWVKYHFTSKSDGGTSEDYEMTILIAGEEKFWGDDCFWVETWSKGRSLGAQQTAILMSYSVFGDTAWLQRLQTYQRKTAMLEDRTTITQQLVHRVMHGKATSDDRPSLTVLTDTLGTDTTSVAGTRYTCVKVQRKAGIGNTEERGDSTMRNENWDRRTLYLSPKVPITSLVREIDERWITRKTWMVGKSNEAVQHYRMRGTGSLDVVSWGSGDLEPVLTPVAARRSVFHTGETRPGKPPVRKRS